MNAIQFLLQHLDTILTLLSIVAVLVLGLVYITKNGRNFINAMLLSFVTIAEKEFGAGTGALKKSQVVRRSMNACRASCGCSSPKPPCPS